MELIAVPRTDDVQVRLAEFLTEEDAVLSDHVDHLRHPYAFAGGAALMGAQISVGVKIPALVDDADLDVAAADHSDAAICDLAVLADQKIGHLFPLRRAS